MVKVLDAAAVAGFIAEMMVCQRQSVNVHDLLNCLLTEVRDEVCPWVLNGAALTGASPLSDSDRAGCCECPRKDDDAGFAAASISI